MLDFGILYPRLGTYSLCDFKDPRNAEVQDAHV